MKKDLLPRILVIDDMFGREHKDRPNRERMNLCGQFLLSDEEAERHVGSARVEITNPLARVKFARGQKPSAACVGDTVENDLEGALEVVRSGWTDALKQGEPPWAMVLLDLCFYTGQVTEESNRRAAGMPEGRPGDDNPASYFGLTLLDAIHSEFPDLPVVILSSMPRKEVSLEFSQRGAVGFISRSDMRGSELLAETLSLHGLLADANNGIIGRSLPLLLALRDARRAAQHSSNVLIRGERGSGKELLARYIHNHSASEHERSFVIVNSAVFSPNLFASELFGIEPRTATGVSGKTGLITAAQGGDLFLDEIADMPGEVQAAMLRVLQERQFTPVGARTPCDVNVRFIAATNVAIEAKASSFRMDLLDRLRLGGTLRLPPLRDRKGDIVLLARHFVREAEKMHPRAMRRTITNETFERLMAHDWPGNIRELRSCLYEAVNRYPDVEYLVLKHLDIESGSGRSNANDQSDKTVDNVVKTLPPNQIVEETVSRKTVSGVIKVMKNTAFPIADAELWAGKIGELQAAQNHLLARYLAAALGATSKRSPDCPQGRVQITPAIKLLTGDPKITASKAADIIKRLLGPLEDELDGDLQDAFNTALRLRPRSNRTQKNSTRIAKIS